MAGPLRYFIFICWKSVQDSAWDWLHASTNPVHDSILNRPLSGTRSYAFLWTLVPASLLQSQTMHMSKQTLLSIKIVAWLGSAEC